VTQSTPADAPTFLQTHPDDNVIVVVRNLPKDTPIFGDTRTLEPHRLGQKLARVPILTGEPVLRYGAPIGTASNDIRPGELVHDHNVVSNYQIATTRRGERA